MPQPSSINIPWGDLSNRIRGLAESFEPDDIAEILRIPRADVDRALDGQSRGRWWIRNTKTGAVRTTFSRRGAYRLVCLLGWTEWQWGIGEVGQGVQP